MKLRIHIFSLSLLVTLASIAIASTVIQHPFLEQLKQQLSNYMEQQQPEKLYLHLDRTLYKPGEDVWFTAYLRDANSLQSKGGLQSIQVQLINPAGSTVRHLPLQISGGQARGDFALPEHFAGGIYTIRATRNGSKQPIIFERKITLQKAILPHLKMKLQFERKAFGAGDEVVARLDLHSLSHQALQNYSFNYTALLDGKSILTQTSKTDKDGRAYIRFQLPSKLSTNDGLLNVLISYQGQRESIARSIPIVLNDIDLQFFPEGGDAVLGIKQQIAFKALNEFGKPADIKGVIENSQGTVVANFNSFHQGMGAFELSAQKGEEYCARITQPVGIEKNYPLPRIWSRGYHLGVQKITKKYVELDVFSTENEAVYIVAQARGDIFYSEKIKLKHKAKTVRIPIKKLPIGIVQLTLFDIKKIERCERLVFVNQNKQLNISVQTDKEKYLPREKVTMTIKVKDERGMPMPGDFSLSVVDDKLLTFADDKQGHILSHMLLESDLKGEIIEPNFYFDKKEKKAAQALDYLMMTQGWRRFNWQEIQQIVPKKESQSMVKTENQQNNKNQIAEKEDILIEPPRTAEPPSPPLVIEVADEEIEEEEKPQFVDQVVAEDNAIAPVTAKLPPPPPPVREEVPEKEIVEQELDIEENLAQEEPIALSNQLRQDAPPPPPPPPPPAPKVEEIFRVVETMPRFPGCEYLATKAEKDQCAQQSLLHYIYSNLTYPTIARDNGIEGTVIVRFVVEKDGSVLDAHVIRDIGAQCGTEALRVVEKMNRDLIKWIPGTQRGNPVRVQFNLPVKFRLDGGDAFLNKNNSNHPNTLFANRTREFYAPKYESKTVVKTRTDFRSTIYWNPHIQVDRNGKAVIEFYNSDDISSFRTIVEGFSTDGDIGRAEHVYYTQLPFNMMAKVPPTVLTGDEINIPLTLSNNTSRDLSGELKVTVPTHFQLLKEQETNITLAKKSSLTVFLNYKIGNQIDASDLKISFETNGLSDEFKTSISTKSRGFPVETLLTNKALSSNFKVNIQHPVEGSIQAKVIAHTNIMSELLTGLDRMLRQPRGCFEQTSSANYPNLLVLDYLKTTQTLLPEIEKTANDFLKKGYERLLGFECKNGGFEWYGREPAHEALTAYGLLEFTDMSKVFPVDAALIQRTAHWLLQRRDGKGSWLRAKKTLHSWDATLAGDAYLVWALCEAGYGENIHAEIDNIYQLAIDSQDPYIQALMANALSTKKDARADVLLKTLLPRQAKNGSWQGLSSIIYSGKKERAIEATALMAIAMIKHHLTDNTQLEQAIDFLLTSKTSHGFGNTQSTVLAMKALIAYAKIVQQQQEDGQLNVYVNEQLVTQKPYQANDINAIEIKGLEEYLQAGQHQIQIKFSGTDRPLPIDLELKYFTSLPSSETACALAVSTSLSHSTIQMSKTTRMTCQLKNQKNETVHSPMVQIGIPAGLSLQAWQLKELQEQKVMDYYEIFDGFLVLHYEAMPALAVRKIHLDLKADIPGQYESPASSAFLYYEHHQKDWAAAEKVTIVR